MSVGEIAPRLKNWYATLSGDATATNSGAITVTKTNGTAFGALATLNAAPAGTLTGTTIGSTVVNSSLTSVGTLVNLTVTNPISGSVTGSSGSATGNAGTATALQTGRAINGVTFDGTAAITVPAAAGTLTGNTIGSTVITSFLTTVGTLTGGATGAGFTLALGTSTLTGNVPVTHGGTNLATLTANAVLLGEGTSNVGFATTGTAGQLLLDQGASTDPAFKRMTGDVAITSAGTTTVQSNTISNAKLAQAVAFTVKGNPTSATANEQDVALGMYLGFSNSKLFGFDPVTYNYCSGV